MRPTETVTYQTPDGVERALRFTLGARKRIAQALGEPNLMVALNRFGDGALPDIAYAMMYDEKGDPPKGLDVKVFAESLDDGAPLLAAIMSAIGKGSVPKNEMEALLRTAMEMNQIGSLSGPSAGSASGSPTPNSGIAQSANLTPSLSDTATASESLTSVPA